MPKNIYSELTETPGMKASKEQLERILHRYKYCYEMAAQKNILEVACGSGFGLPYLARVAKSVTGIDIDEKNILKAKQIIEKNEHKDKITVKQMDAHSLLFPDASFDLLILFEAIYYLENPEKFIKEAARVLTKNGILIIVTVNKDWDDFHPSPFTHKYFSVTELKTLTSEYFSSVNFSGGFPTGRDNKLFSFIKKFAVKFKLIPGSLKARSYLKRFFMGKLTEIPEIISDKDYNYMPPVPVGSDTPNKDFKILYMLAEKKFEKN